ncbi:acyl--CoA ligase [Bacillus ginsengihumi]|uniref:Acyl--CoA ligase n=1 Tax=Heyndrickxia ginsengihumi TaxID=363870 RepID=A0A6M0PAZ5_9BACI|nr:acyl--CoA ligase [Heyndrickxia ginsengihumi]NEY21555.1 acyl--CoA ligase [Heyndrickxia ginsengihumi]
MRREELLAPEIYNIAEEVEKFAQGPEKLALIWEDDQGAHKEVTYQQLIKNANRIGNIFLANGLKKGDTILVMVPRVVEAYEVYLAALKLGLPILPSSEMLRTKDLQYRIQAGDVKGIVSYYNCASQFKDVEEIDTLKKFVIGQHVEDWVLIDEEKSNVSDELEMTKTSKDDMAFLSYTSGTTGNPKGVVHTHGWGYAHLRTAAPNWLCIEENDLVWATAAPGWQKWVWSPLLSVLGSGAVGFVYNGRFEPKKYLQLLDDKKINVLCCTPTEYRLMAKVDNLSSYHLTYLRSAVSAGEPLNREVIDLFKKYFNVQIRDGYGQTENTLLVGTLKDMEVRPGSMGKPFPGNRVEIIDENGQICEAGVVGDIAVHRETPALFKEYYKEPERTAQQYRGEYYVTGDRARKDEDGYYWFEGRRDDVIISSGYTIGPFEVEDALVKHPFVKECAVVASPHEIRGNIVKAYIVLQEGVDRNQPDLVKQLQSHVKQLTAPYKYPRAIEFIDELPKTSSGKIRRVELRERELNK